MGDWDFSIYNYLLLLSAGALILIVSFFFKKHRAFFKCLLFCAAVIITISTVLIIKWKMRMDERDRRREERGVNVYTEKQITQV